MWRKALVLGIGLAAIAFGPAAAQTVVGGDGRPDVVVDHSVLDRLGPQPTLPDLLLGRQPVAPPGAPVKLHRPHATTSVATLKPPKSTTTKKIAKVDRPPIETPAKPKPVKAAKAAKPKEDKTQIASVVTKTPDQTDPTIPAKPSKSLSSNYATPPPVPPAAKPTVVANADMPAGASVSNDTPPAKVTTPPAVKPLTSSVANTDATPAPKPAVAPAPATPPATNTTTSNSDAAPVASTPPTPPAPPPATASNDKPAASKPDTKMAMLTPPPAVSAPAEPGVALTIPFAKDGATLSDDGRNALMGLAKQAATDASMQLQVLAYASGDEENASKARRLSLSRALVVRSFLIDQGIHSTRIEVRALGNKVPDGAPDRVDLVEQKH